MLKILRNVYFISIIVVQRAIIPQLVSAAFRDLNI